MKYFVLLIITAGVFMVSCNKNEKPEEVQTTTENPFFSDYGTPYESAPFDKIKNEHYLPAFNRAIEENRTEVETIVNNTEEPTFENTIVAMEKTGKLMNKVIGVFFNLTSAHTNPEMQKIEEEITPLLTELSDEISFNQQLFERIKIVNENKDKFNLTAEELKVLDNYFKSFVRSGANLNDEDKAILGQINKDMSNLTLKFGKNILDETNKFEMLLENKDDLDGLPEGLISAAADAAEAKGYDGKWLFGIQKSSFIPFITYSTKRDLREKILTAYNMMGNNGDELDNNEIAKNILKLRLKKANVLGYPTWANYVLEENMAKVPVNVYDLAKKVWTPAVANAKIEAKELQAMVDKEGGKFKLAAWDWWFYAEKLRKEKYDLDEEQLRPYFEIENVRDGAFLLANKLWGITFEERNDIPIYQEDVKTFEVKNADGSHIGILYVDYFPRESKRGGAWMNAYRAESNIGGNKVTPIICNVCNFTKPTGDTPSLITFEEVTTLFHEFGHALHGLLAKSNYPNVAGTSVARDFVELPSQIMENWCGEPEMLKLYAKHYKTGEVIPDELIEKLQKASKFNQGFITTEFMSAAILDMDYHTMTADDIENLNIQEFEKASLVKMGLIDEIVVRYRSTYFRHIFGDPIGYSSGYYGYIWAAVLDADAFAAFKETGDIFNKEVATKYRNELLSQGGSSEPMTLYKNFRGAEPKIEPLLKRRGLMK